MKNQREEVENAVETRKQTRFELEHTQRELEECRNPNRLAARFLDAERRGLVRRCEADQLAFFAAAERAKRVAIRNIAGFFVHIVRNGCFGFMAQQDEDAARTKISAIRELYPGMSPLQEIGGTLLEFLDGREAHRDHSVVEIHSVTASWV
jgi:hypothetical protein